MRSILFSLFLIAALVACTPTPIVNEYITNNYYVTTDTGADDTGTPAVDYYLGAPTPNTEIADMSVDVFGSDGNVLYLS
ncbi:hypothetical protein EBT31_20260, partial [bacterium]|nr:hypothetical protein [bacterium]